MSNDANQSGPTNWQEARRFRALELKEQGWSQKLIAEAFGVSQAAVSQWMRQAREQGRAALKAQPRPGARPRLSAAQLEGLPDLLSHGAEAYGFRGELWTCERVGEVIAREFGVRYHPAHVSRLLKKLQWTPQRPMTQATQRDENRIRQWQQERWPILYDQAQRTGRTPVFVDEAAFYLLPGLVKTYAPKGVPPVLTVCQSYDHLSMMSGITPSGSFYTLIRDFALTSHEVVLFLTHLLRHVATPLLVIWDGAPIHRTGEVPLFLTQLSQRLLVEPLPPYAPDLNPTEGVWQLLKHVELANLVAPDLLQLRDELDLAISRLRLKPDLIRACFDQAGLALSLA